MTDRTDPREALAERIAAMFPKWTVVRIVPHSAWARHDGEVIEDERGHSITVPGWVVTLRNRHGKSIATTAFAEVEDIDRYRIARYEDMQP